jgi:hypothetical protein
MAASIRAPRFDFIDVLERALTKGVVFEIEDDVEATAADRDALDSSTWFRISIAGVDVFKIGAGLSLRYLL